MDNKTWVHQLKKQVDKFGEKDAPWYVSWYDPDGKLRTKSCGPGKIGLNAAKTLADKTHAELITGTYKPKQRSNWAQLRLDYDKKIASRLGGPSQEAAKMALDNFQRVAKPKLLESIDTAFIDTYVENRQKEFAERTASAKKVEGTVLTPISPATINKELRCVRAILNIAKEWKLISEVPKIRFLKVVKLLPTFTPPEHLAAIYQACSVAVAPNGIPNVTPATWWRGLIILGYMTGWRVGQLLSLKWSDVDLEKGTATTRADVTGNKGKREERIPLHPIVIDHLRLMAGSFDAHGFRGPSLAEVSGRSSKQSKRMRNWRMEHRCPKGASAGSGTGSTICVAALQR